MEKTLYNGTDEARWVCLCVDVYAVQVSWLTGWLTDYPMESDTTVIRLTFDPIRKCSRSIKVRTSTIRICSAEFSLSYERDKYGRENIPLVTSAAANSSCCWQSEFDPISTANKQKSKMVSRLTMRCETERNRKIYSSARIWYLCELFDA